MRPFMRPGGRDVDVLSEAAGKGMGLSFLLKRLKEAGFEPSNVQASACMQITGIPASELQSCTCLLFIISGFRIA